MGEYEPNDSRDVTGANNASSGQAAGSGQVPSEAPGSEALASMGLGGENQMSQQAAEGSRSAGQMGQPHGNAQMGGGQTGSGQQQQFQQGGGQMGGGSSAFGGSDQAGRIREHMEVIGADGVHLGTVDAIEGDRIKLTRRDSDAGFEGGRHEGHHHYLPLSLVAEVEGERVRLSANADVAYGMEQEEDESGSGSRGGSESGNSRA